MRTDNPTLAEKLASAIADGILDGSLPPGVRLDEISLAQQHGVSRTPVREALRQLTTSGLIDMRPRKGAVVSKATPEQVENLFVAMAEMEGTCARLAAMSMTPIERRRLQARHEAMLALAKAGNRDAYSDANVAFHLAIYAGAHNEPLAEFTRGLRRRVGAVPPRPILGGRPPAAIQPGTRRRRARDPVRRRGGRARRDAAPCQPGRRRVRGVRGGERRLERLSGHLKCQRLPCSGMTKRTPMSLPASSSCSICFCGCSFVSEYLMWLTTTGRPLSALPPA